MGGGAGGGRAGPRPNWVRISYEYRVGDRYYAGRDKAPDALELSAVSHQANQGIVGQAIDVYYDIRDSSRSRLSPLYDIGPFFLVLGSQPFLVVILFVIYGMARDRCSCDTNIENRPDGHYGSRTLLRLGLMLAAMTSLLIALNGVVMAHALWIGDRLTPPGSHVFVAIIAGVFLAGLVVILVAMTLRGGFGLSK